MKNLMSSPGILNHTVRVMKLCLMALSMVSVPLFVKPVFASSYHFVSAVVPQVRETFSAWLTPTVLYVLVNCIILAILANSKLQHRFNITGRPHEEHNPAAAQQKQQELIYVEEPMERSGTTELEEEEKDDEESIERYGTTELEEEEKDDEESIERSGTTELEEEEKDDEEWIERSGTTELEEEEKDGEESIERSGTTELEKEEKEVSSAARSERIRTPDVCRVERPLATSRFNTNHRKSASAKSATEIKSLGILRSKKKAETLEATWKAITEGRGPPLTRHLRKSETLETAHRAEATEGASPDSSSAPVFQKSETWNKARNHNLREKPEFALALRKDPSQSQDELNKRVEAFIAKMNNDMKLQREQSLLHYMEMVNRGANE